MEETIALHKYFFGNSLMVSRKRGNVLQNSKKFVRNSEKFWNILLIYTTPAVTFFHHRISATSLPDNTETYAVNKKLINCCSYIFCKLS